MADLIFDGVINPAGVRFDSSGLIVTADTSTIEEAVAALDSAVNSGGSGGVSFIDGGSPGSTYDSPNIDGGSPSAVYT